MPVVDVKGLQKKFGDHLVLDHLDISIEEGEVVALVGRSGSGKSTLLRCIGGLEVFQKGTVQCGEQVLTAGQEATRNYYKNVGTVFQHYNLFPHLTASGNVTIALRRVHKLDRETIRRRADASLATVGLTEKANAHPIRLSGGQQQRVAIARALALHPRILLLDEVTSALDPELVEEVTQVLRGLADQGNTMLIVTHDISFARSVADRIVFMHLGQIHEQGSPDRLLVEPKTEEFRRFLGIENSNNKWRKK